MNNNTILLCSSSPINSSNINIQQNSLPIHQFPLVKEINYQQAPIISLEPASILSPPPVLSRINHLEDWPRLSSHPELCEMFKDPPNITYKHSPNLSQLLVRAKLNENIPTNLPTNQPPSIPTISFPAKSIKCRNSQCGTCQQLTSRSHYSSYQTKQYYSIPDIFSCDTTHAIYLLDCSICSKQYIGETRTTIRNRMKHH